MDNEVLKLPDWINNITHVQVRNTIEKGYANSQKIDPSVQEAMGKLLEIVNDKGEVLNQDAFQELVDSMKVFQSGFVTLDKTDIKGPESVENDNPTLMLASASKRFMVEQLFAELLKLGNKLEDNIFTFTYSSLNEALAREREFGTNNSIIDQVPALRTFVNEENKLIATEEEYAAADVKVDFKTLSYLILTLSCNGALATGMGTLYSLWESLESTTSRRKSQEKFAAVIRTETAKDYELRINSEGRFAEQPASNGEPVKGLILDIQAQVERFNHAPEKILLSEAIKNNTSDFGFDFTNSEMGEKLRKQGCDIYEKTGSYPSVYWMPKLSEQGFPPHIVMLTTVTIKFPNGELKSFVYYELIHMPYSPDPADAPGDLVENWPDEDSPRYAVFAAEVEKQNKAGFRQRMQESVEAAGIILEG